MRGADAVLCYVEGPWAFFTTKPLADQWGDDWDDAPYEHNAEEPYEPGLFYFADGRTEKRPADWNEDGSPKWRIYRIAWSGPFETPDAWVTNSPWSVQQINTGATPWLKPAEFATERHGVSIPAGTTLAAFIELLESVGGTAYLPRNASVSVPSTGGDR
jgi:hypothetical protein